MVERNTCDVGGAGIPNDIISATRGSGDRRKSRTIAPAIQQSQAPRANTNTATSTTMRSSLPILALASVTSAARFLLQIPITNIVNPSALSSTTHATLQSSGPPLDAYLSRSNTFNFNNVSVGSYLATVHCRDYAFEPLRIDVSIEEPVEGSGDKKEVIRAWQTFLGNEWDNKGESRGEGGNGLVVEARPLGQKEFYQERAGCKLHSSPDTPLKIDSQL